MGADLTRFAFAMLDARALRPLNSRGYCENQNPRGYLQATFPRAITILVASTKSIAPSRRAYSRLGTSFSSPRRGDHVSDNKPIWTGDKCDKTVRIITMELYCAK
jgi:hypothetical protein